MPGYGTLKSVNFTNCGIMSKFSLSASVYQYHDNVTLNYLTVRHKFSLSARFSLYSPDREFIWALPCSFRATVCKTVRPMLSDRLSCLSVLSVFLSVTLVYCGQTVAWIKMKLGMQEGLGPGHIVLDGDPPALLQKGADPQFSAISVVAKWLGGSRSHLVGR